MRRKVGAQLDTCITAGVRHGDSPPTMRRTWDLHCCPPCSPLFASSSGTLHNACDRAQISCPRLACSSILIGHHSLLSLCFPVVLSAFGCGAFRNPAAEVAVLLSNEHAVPPLAGGLGSAWLPHASPLTIPCKICRTVCLMCCT